MSHEVTALWDRDRYQPFNLLLHLPIMRQMMRLACFSSGPGNHFGFTDLVDLLVPLADTNQVFTVLNCYLLDLSPPVYPGDSSWATHEMKKRLLRSKASFLFQPLLGSIFKAFVTLIFIQAVKHLLRHLQPIAFVQQTIVTGHHPMQDAWTFCHQLPFHFQVVIWM
jgi:hypothetical protein